MLQLAAGALETAARAYKAEHGRPVTLVIDNSDRLADDAPELLKMLQAFAHDWAAHGLVNVIFAARTQSSLRQLSGEFRVLNLIFGMKQAVGMMQTGRCTHKTPSYCPHVTFHNPPSSCCLLLALKRLRAGERTSGHFANAKMITPLTTDAELLLLALEVRGASYHTSAETSCAGGCDDNACLPLPPV